MKIGIIGRGNLGRTLAALWQAQGYQIVEGAQAEVVLYTTARPQPRSWGHWNGQTVIDCRLPPLQVGFDFATRERSLAEELADELPTCNLVKAFCLHPMELYQHGPEQLNQWGIQSFFCGDLAAAKEQVKPLIEACGLLPFDCGSLRRARQLENLGDFWRLFQLGQGQGLVSQFQLVGYPEPDAYPYGGERTPLFVPPDDTLDL